MLQNFKNTLQFVLSIGFMLPDKLLSLAMKIRLFFISSFQSSSPSGKLTLTQQMQGELAHLCYLHYSCFSRILWASKAEVFA